MKYRFDPEGRRLPIKLDSTSNGEFAPIPLEPRNRHANALAQEAATRNARRTGLGRRAFLISAAGAATSLLAINAPTRPPVAPAASSRSRPKRSSIPRRPKRVSARRNSSSTCRVIT